MQGLGGIPLKNNNHKTLQLPLINENSFVIKRDRGKEREREREREGLRQDHAWTNSSVKRPMSYSKKLEQLEDYNNYS